jgi:two-component system chemotaxis response regulator CheY
MERMRTLVKEQVRALGYSNFEYAENGEKAMQMLIQQAHSKPFDLILSDWNMPVVSGLDFLKNVRSNPQFVRVPFLMVTAEADRESVLSAIKAGASNYIVKPFKPSTFDQKLQVIAKNINAVRIST